MFGIDKSVGVNFTYEGQRSLIFFFFFLMLKMSWYLG